MIDHWKYGDLLLGNHANNRGWLAFVIGRDTRSGVLSRMYHFLILAEDEAGPLTQPYTLVAAWEPTVWDRVKP